MSAQEVGAWMLKEVGVTVDLRWIGHVGLRGGWKAIHKEVIHIFFCWCKKFTTENNKSDGKFLGEPQAKFRGDIEVYIEVHIRSIFLARFFLWPEKKQHCPPKLYQLLFFWTHALNVTNVVLVGN